MSPLGQDLSCNPEAGNKGNLDSSFSPPPLITDRKLEATLEAVLPLPLEEVSDRQEGQPQWRNREIGGESTSANPCTVAQQSQPQEMGLPRARASAVTHIKLHQGRLLPPALGSLLSLISA